MEKSSSKVKPFRKLNPISHKRSCLERFFLDKKQEFPFKYGKVLIGGDAFFHASG